MELLVSAKLAHSKFHGIHGCKMTYFGHNQCSLTHCGREDLSKWTIFNTILTSPKSWLSQEDLDAGCEH